MATGLAVAALVAMAGGAAAWAPPTPACGRSFRCGHAFPAAATCRRRPARKTAPAMAVGDILRLEWADVSEVQEGVRSALADGKRVIELEIPTTDRFKDTPLNRINEANTLYVREFVRMFTQPQELCVVFTDAAECKYAIEDWGGGPVPFKLSSLIKPQPMEASVNKYVVMNPTFDVREYSYMDDMYSSEIQPKDATMIIFNAELFKLRSGGLMGYYPDIIFPKLAQVRRRLMPQVETAYYLRIFRGPPVGALYKKYPGPWMVLRALEDGQFDVLAEFAQQAPPLQDEVFQILQKAGPAPVQTTDAGGSEQDKALARMGLAQSRTEVSQQEPGFVNTGSAGAELPGGWASAVDPATGQTYYYNEKGETSWEPPV